jgi:DNA repair protein RadC
MAQKTKDVCQGRALHDGVDFYSTSSTIRGSAQPIREWRADERPREKLMQLGPQYVSDSELLAILIGTGTQGFSAVDIARTLLREFSSLSGLGSRSPSELKNIRGMGQAKAVILAAAFELGRRYQQEAFNPSLILHSPEDVARYFIPRMRGARTESFYIAMLNTANIVIGVRRISEGSLNASIVHPREVFRTAVVESAASIIAVHNHPSGNTEPSREDIALTQQLIQAGKMMSIPLLDHLIIAGEQFTSLRERGHF